MVELYGPSFCAAYGDSPSPIWTAAIGDLTNEECRAGLTRLAKQPREYPANLTQFMAACKPAQGVRFLGTPMTPQEVSALLPAPEYRATPEKIDYWIAKMRAKVAG